MRISKLFDFDNEFTDEMFDDLDIPEETPEEKSAKLKRLMELVKEREKEQEKLKEQKRLLLPKNRYMMNLLKRQLILLLKDYLLYILIFFLEMKSMIEFMLLFKNKLIS